MVHPIGIKYLFKGNIEQWGNASATELELRLGWRPRTEVPLLNRIESLAEALLATRETLYLGRAQSGGLAERRNRLIEHLLATSESRFQLADESGANPLGRVRRLRSALSPLLLSTKDVREKDRLLHSLDGIELAQELYSYPDRYLLN